MTTTDNPIPLAALLKEAIPAHLRNRMKAHDLEAGRWLEPLMDWVDKAIVLSQEYNTAVDATGLTHIDDIWHELMPGTGMDRIDLLLRLIQHDPPKAEPPVLYPSAVPVYGRLKTWGSVMKFVARIFVIAAVLALAVPASAGGRPLSAGLSSANEVPSSGTGASGSADVTLNQGQGEICVDISTSGLSSPVVAGHIHSAPAGVNGGVVVNLGVNSDQFSACVQGVDGALIKAIRQSPENYYINVHTTGVPSGEIRGQLSK